MVAMTTLRFPAVVAHAIFTLVTVTAMAKIMPPKPVAPVDGNGVRYSADRDGRDQYAVATDIATGKQLWKVKVFHKPIKFWIKEDVQWVFITNLRLMDNTLFVRDGKARCYAVDIKTQRVRKASCSPAFTSHEGAPQWPNASPEWANC
jgi:outer membrane protein assembly factor BamB